MSMEDILNQLVNSRQPGSSSNAADPMASLIGGLLGGGQQQAGGGQQSGTDLAGNLINLVGTAIQGAQGQQGGAQQQPSGGLGDVMGLLENVMNGAQGGSQPAASDPIMMLLQPFVTPLAKKANISPEIALIVVSFVAHKLLAHHPSSGRDSSSFNLDTMLQQMTSGKIDTNMLQDSGMVQELANKTGLDQATAAKSLGAAFGMMGEKLQGGKPTLPPKGKKK